MCLVENDDMIETLAAHRSNQSLRIGILPRAQRTRDDLADAHAGDPAPEHIAIDGVAIPQEPAWRCVVRKGFNDLLRCPCGRRMFRDRDVNDSSALVREQHQHE